MKAVNKFLKKKTSRILILILLDICMMILSAIFALWLRFDFNFMPIQYIKGVFEYIIIDIILMICVFKIFRLYTSIWQYASINELMRVGMSCVIVEVLSFLYRGFLNVNLFRSYYIIHLLVFVILIAEVRFSYRILRTIIIKIEDKYNDINTMIVGAGEAGRLLINEIRVNRNSFNNKIVCVIDDNKEVKNTYIKGIPIVGNRKKIESACKKYEIEEIIIAIPSATKEEISSIVEECQKTKCKIKILPKISNMMDRSLMKKVKELSYEDFLGRDQIVINVSEVEDSIKDKTVMVTGGGGSIGSELCRQIAKCSPKKLIIFDIYENNAYEIQQELLRNYPELDLEAIIGSVRDYDRMEKVFKEYKFDEVFHAAAHKHVPLMEVSPNEAIKNNCLGTLNVAKLCDKYKVKKMVLISTDKAVRPTNVMGASKRICEMIIQSLNKKSKNTDYVAVRFGNVLGSNGSVIPLFLKQIDNGGPVTVTHKEMTRFFMTIPEAVSLVLQASVYALGGEIFILDMGKPVKIYDLAEKLIRFKGYEPNVDIPIKITGLRPGEKLYEEILMDEEGLKETPNKLIHIGRPIDMDEEKFLKDLDKLIEAAYKNNDDIKDKVAKIVPTYTVDKRNLKK
ncbi:MAG: polysaccharide biosynthesis protein [Bacilli bacterium]|nr:polysaccharide biosynthesis protein [Bacilli bacterium]